MKNLFAYQCLDHIEDLNKFDFYELLKLADKHNWRWNLYEHCHYTQSFYVLVYKNEIIRRLSIVTMLI
jgi:hypothetical protein